MASKVFLDANVLLDFLLKRNHYKEIREIMHLVIEGKVNAYITPAIVHIVGYWLTKVYGSEKAKHLLLNLLDSIHSIDISHELTLLALNSKISDIEDALQYYTAIHYQLDYFISSDKKIQMSAIPSLPVISALHFLTVVYRY